MTWVYRVSAELDAPVADIGAKAEGLVALHRLGLPVPPAFVITTAACRSFLRDGGVWPVGLIDELTAAHRALGASAVSVRSGAAVSMPGMMDTVLDVRGQDALTEAVEAVFRSWETPRARTYRELNGIPHDLGTAVIVQAMVFGDRDSHSGTGVAFSRDPNTGEPKPYGDVLFGHRGEDVVAGTTPTRPLSDLAAREPAVWTDLVDMLARIEAHYRDACYLEFTYETGVLWALQIRPGRFVGRAAVRLAVDLVDAGVLTRAEAAARVTARDLAQARTPRLAAADVFTRGLGASPGVAVGRVATTADTAVRMTGPVILVRPSTSPLDMHGLAAAAGVVTARGGPASHAAVVARSMGKPAVVGAADIGLADGTLVAIDGTSGVVALGSPPIESGADDEHLSRFLRWTDPENPL